MMQTDLFFVYAVGSVISISGKIPNYIQNWKSLEALRISDLNGSEAAFPPLNKVTGLETLILRSCNIIGQLPEYLKDMTALKTSLVCLGLLFRTFIFAAVSFFFKVYWF
ncbi:hypothetical protein CJ030_MR4G029044 [Morella rubra]|uniref:Uncharacterized protein n=1 Tax=Morella rubra TaxID=262757 RepID=A0A6A1VY00_9ROSI|nr:hypothetical protein CJ030_MR4G029044 [Morella rubra]